MRLCAISDLHGNIPTIPDCDVLMIAGDVVVGDLAPVEQLRQWQAFDRFLITLAERRIIVIGCAGNHDLLLQEAPTFAASMPWLYLQDSGVELAGIKFWGTPWTPNQFWAFGGNDDDLAPHYDKIPQDTNVLISHGPPAGVLDRVGKRNIGSVHLSAAVERVQPDLMVFGHVHRPGIERVEGVTCANVTVCNPKYQNVHPPTVFDV